MIDLRILVAADQAIHDDDTRMIFFELYVQKIPPGPSVETNMVELTAPVLSRW